MSIVVRRFLLLGALTCALTMAVVPAQASAASGEPPTIEGGRVKQANEHDATLEVWIDPHGNETSYTVWLECQSEHEPLLPCEPVANDQLVQGTIPAGLEGVQTIDIELTGLTPGFAYWYAIRAVGAGKLVETRQNLFGIEKPREAELPSWVKTMSEAESAQRIREYEARHGKELEAQHAREHEEQEFKEAAARATEAAARKQREEREHDKGGLSLAGTNVVVEGNGVTLISLECLGTVSCRGKLTLAAKMPSKAKDKEKSMRTTAATTIGTVSFSIAGDETKTVRVKLDAAGRALLEADQGRCGASLAILELAPGVQDTQTKSVRLLQREATKARKS